MARWVYVPFLALVTAGIAAAQGCGSDRHEGFTPPEDDGGTGEGSPSPAPTGTTPGFKDGGAGVSADCKAAADAKGYIGCDFRVLVPFVGGVNAAPCFAVFLANASATKPAQVKVSHHGQTYANASDFARVPNDSRDVTTWSPLPKDGIPPQKVAVLFLFDAPGSESPMGGSLSCPVPALTHDGPGVALELMIPGRGTTFRVESDEPVTAYDIMPFGGARSFAPSANLLLPTSAWGKNYVAVQPPYVERHPGDPPSDSGWLAVAATEDGTHVDVLSPTDLGTAVDADGVSPNVKKTITLAAGEYLKWSNYRRAGLGDATGTILSSDKPIAVWGGDHVQNVHSTSNAFAHPYPDAGHAADFCCTDSFHQQIPPVSGLGFDYAAAPHPTRFASREEEAILYRLVSVADGTAFTFDPPIAGAPTSLDRGTYADVEVKGAFRVKSQDNQHPFYVAQAMTYSSLTGPTRNDGDPTWSNVNIWAPPTLGDPDQIAILPPAQFLKTYAFFTDPTYAATSLVLTRVKGASGFADVTVDCVGTVQGWAPIGGAGDLEFARVDLSLGFQSASGCKSGAHSASSNEPFGVAVWGLDWWASYAYPAGGSVAQLNDVVVPPNPR